MNASTPTSAVTLTAMQAPPFWTRWQVASRAGTPLGVVEHRGMGSRWYVLPSGGGHVLPARTRKLALAALTGDV